MKNKAKSCPPGPPGPGAWADNYLWIDGEGELRSLIQRKEWSIESEVGAIERRLSGFKTKTVKGKEYLYEWVNSAWKYLGAVEPGADIRHDLRLEIQSLQEKKKAIGPDCRKCILQKVGKNHLIVATRRREGEFIQLKTLFQKSIREKKRSSKTRTTPPKRRRSK